MSIEEVWEEYSFSLRSYLLSKLSNPDDVDDLLQEIFIKSHSNLDNIGTDEGVKPWLFKVTNNALIDFYRKRGREQAVQEDHLWFGDEEPDDVSQELVECVLPFIHELPEEDAELLLAIDIYNQSQKSFAEEIGISYSTLKSRVQKSRKMLMTLYHQCCDFELDKHGRVIDYEPKSEWIARKRN